MGVALEGRLEPSGRVRPFLGLSTLFTLRVSAFMLRFAALRSGLPIILAATLVFSAAPALADIQYIYDAAGRLAQVVAADGTSAVYLYDSAGNITGIQRLAANQLALTAFSPTGGGPGTQVTLQGTGFSTTASANVVKFNGTTASVLAATVTQLIVQVPGGATSGLISLTVGSQTVSSSQPFTILPLPTISSFTPASGVIGTVVTLSGTNLNPIPRQTTLTVNGLHVPISSASNQQITFQVPANVGSGPIVVTTAYGRATTTTNLLVTPAGIDPGSIVLNSSLTVGGAASATNLSSNGKYAQFIFQGKQGDYLSLQLSSFTSSNNALSYSVYDGTNSVISSGTLSPSTASVHLPPLISTGTYSVFFGSGSGTDHFSVALEKNPTVTPDGSPINISGARGQTKRFLIAAAANANIGLGFTNLVKQNGVLDHVSVSVYKPDGSTVTGAASQSCTDSTGCDLSLAGLAAGLYGVLVESPDSTTEPNFALSYTATVSNDVVVPLTAGTPATTSLSRAGQHARLTFSGSIGAAAGVQVVVPSTTPSGQIISVAVLNPDGTTLVSGSDYGGYALQIPSLPTAGTYTIFIEPQNGAAAANLTARLVTTVGGAVPVDGAAQADTGGTYSYFGFSASVGDNIGVGISNLVMQNAVSDNVSVTVYNPDGTQFNDGTVTCYAATGCGLSLANLPATGLYGVVLVSPDPSAEQSLAVSYTATVSHDVVVPLTAGTPASASLSRLGQHGRLTFSGTSGAAAGVQVVMPSTNPSGQIVSVTAVKPDGTTLVSGSDYGGYAMQIPSLPITGAYAILIEPQNGATGTVTAKLVTAAAGAVTVNGATQTISGGTYSYFGFSASAGNNIRIGISNLVLQNGGSNNVSVSVYGPDGNSVGGVVSQSCSIATGCNLSLTSLPATGLYGVVVGSPNPSSEPGLLLSYKALVSSH